jgi:hypothetical protein
MDNPLIIGIFFGKLARLQDNGGNAPACAWFSYAKLNEEPFE